MSEDNYDPPITVRVPAEWLERAEALAGAMASNKTVRGFGRPTRGMIARLAMMRGLEVLEHEFTRTRRRKAKS